MQFADNDVLNEYATIVTWTTFRIVYGVLVSFHFTCNFWSLFLVTVNCTGASQ